MLCARVRNPNMIFSHDFFFQGQRKSFTEKKKIQFVTIQLILIKNN